MTNTNLKALAEAVKACAHADNELPIDQIPWELALEAAALLTALAEPLGEEPLFPGTNYLEEEFVRYQTSRADYWRTACLQARAENESLKAELSTVRKTLALSQSVTRGDIIKVPASTLGITHICDGEEVVTGGVDGQVWIATFASAIVATMFVDELIHTGRGILGEPRDSRE